MFKKFLCEILLKKASDFFKRVMRTIIKTIWFSHMTESEERIQNSALLGGFFIIKIATQ